MKYKFLIIFLGSIVNFHIINGYRNNLDDTFALAKSVWKLYRSSSIVVIADEINLRDLHFQKQLIQEIRKCSENGIKSQGMSYSVVERMKKDFCYSTDTRIGTKIMFTIFINDEKHYEYYQKLFKVRNVWAYTWLVIIKNTTSFDCAQPQGNPFNLQLNSLMIVKCGNHTSINKYYSIFKNVTEITELGTWTADRKFIVNSKAELIQEKINLKGLLLTQAELTNSSHRFNKKSRKFYKEFIEIIKIIGNFTSKIIVRRDTNGIFNATSNQWIGITNVLANKMVDMTATTIFMSKNRLEVMDFTVPIKTLKNKIFLKLPNSIDIRWDSYFKVFNKYTWILIALIILLSTTLLVLTKSEKVNMDFNSFFEVLTSVWSIFCQQGFLDTPPFNKSTQILYFTLMILSLILNSIYSASITSYLTMANIELPYNSYDEFIRDISYKVVVIRGTKEHDDINSDDPLLLPLKDQMVNYWKLPIGLIEAFNEVCTNNVAFYTYEIDLRSLKILSPCPVAGLTVPRITQVSLGLSKYSPYTKMLNYYILNLRDKGIINRLKEHIFFQYDPEIKSKANQISILEVIPILFIWGLGILISIIILFIEILYYRLHNY